jgi:cellulose synthase/poly-beta-1,6-N-acetylglucosamine synthase-like glycosyltransferase
MRLTALVLVALPIVLGLYSYIIYPTILRLMALGKRQATPPTPGAKNAFPLVTVVVPAYNEETQIRGAIEALLAQTYPHERMQILILSDASTDATDSIVAEYASQGVELMRMPARSGKTAIENAAIPLIRGDVVVNSDSSTRLHRDAILFLIEQLADPEIGVASGRDVSVTSGDTSANSVEGEYVDYEMRLRALETRTGGIVGASGCCYAIRAELHRMPIPPDLSRDFSAALTAREHGQRAVSVDAAIAFVPRTKSLRREYVRKVRTISRGMETLVRVRYMLNPFRFGMFAWKLFSHKVCRWLMPLTAVPAAAGLAFLARSDPWAQLTAGGAVIVGATAIVGATWPESKRVPRLIGIIAFSVSANVAVVHGIVRLLRASEDKTWEPTRRDAVVLPE